MIKEKASPLPSEAFDPTRLSLSEQRYLAGPLVQPRLNGWDFPEQLRAVVPVARILQMLHGQADALERDLASEEEALGYLSCASLEAPLDRDWTEIMCYLAQEVFPRWRFIPDDAVHAVLGYTRPIALNSAQAEDLRRRLARLRRIAAGKACGAGCGAQSKTVRKQKASERVRDIDRKHSRSEININGGTHNGHRIVVS